MMPSGSSGDREGGGGGMDRPPYEVSSDPDLAAHKRLLANKEPEMSNIFGKKGSDGGGGRHPDSAEVGKMMDDTMKRSSTGRFSFKEGFFSESEMDLKHHHRHRPDVEGYHRKEDFPHMRPKMALAIDHHRHHRHHGSPHRQKDISGTVSVPYNLPSAKQNESVDSDHIVIEMPRRDEPDHQDETLSSVMSAPSMLPLLEQMEEEPDNDGVPRIVIDSVDQEDSNRSKKKSLNDVMFFLGDESHPSMDSVPSPMLSSFKKPETRDRRSSSHVQFSVGSLSSLDDGTGGAGGTASPAPSPAPRHGERSQHRRSAIPHKHRHHRSSSRSTSRTRSAHVPHADELAERRFPGSFSEMKGVGGPVSTGHQQIVVFDDDKELSQVDLEGLRSHRFSKVGGAKKKVKKKTNAMATVIDISSRPASSTENNANWSTKQKPDRRPHDLFVELDELHVADGEDMCEWREKARWIKFEEDVEEGAERWGKPHVASLDFHSLVELRKVLSKGQVILDMEEDGWKAISRRIVKEFIQADQITEEQSEKLLKYLLLKHKHVNDSPKKMRRNLSYNNLLNLDTSHSAENAALKRTSAGPSGTSLSKAKSVVTLRSWFSRRTASNLGHKSTLNGTSTDKVSEEGVALTQSASAHVITDTTENGGRTVITTGPPPALKRSESSHSATTIIPTTVMTALSHVTSHKSAILHRIPTDSEATTVLAGRVDFLDQPVMAFVRLAVGQNLGNLSEVPLPMRFLFMCMGPDVMDYHEVGRSIATLLSNKHFHDMAYAAEGREDLLAAINDFLGESLVLPPGEWGKSTLQPIIAMANAKARKRQKVADKEEEQKKLLEKDGDKAARGSAGSVGSGGGGGRKDDGKLERTRRLFGGLRQDVKRRYPMYWSDIKDGFNMTGLSTIIFIFFACIAPAITFGQLVAKATDGFIGVAETMLGTCVMGVLFSLFSGQPLNIVGVSGASLIFEATIFTMAQSTNIDYPSFRFWTHMWVALANFFMVMFDLVVVVKYIQRFTEEIFSFFISTLFIFSVVMGIWGVFKLHPLQAVYPTPTASLSHIILDSNVTLNDTVGMLLEQNAGNTFLTSIIDSYNITINDTVADLKGIDLSEESIMEAQPNTALMSFVICILTFYLADMLKKFRNSKYLGRCFRRRLGDFGIPLSILVMSLIVYFSPVYTARLIVPDGLQPTNADKRGWLINPTGHFTVLPVEGYFFAAVAALVHIILGFMESQITSVVVNKKERNLKKGGGYHLDLLLVGVVFPLISGVMSLPMMNLATIRSVTHVSALSIFSTTNAPGEKQKMLGVYEQRVTNFFVHVGIGASLFFGPALREIPIAVLYGVFFYMGWSSLGGTQFFERVLLVLKLTKHHPREVYTVGIKTRRMHSFTCIQIVIWIVLVGVQLSPFPVLFPFLLLLTVPFSHFGLKYIYKEHELKALNSGGGEKEDDDDDDIIDRDGLDEDDLDFYQQAHYPI